MAGRGWQDGGEGKREDERGEEGKGKGMTGEQRERGRKGADFALLEKFLRALTSL